MRIVHGLVVFLLWAVAMVLMMVVCGIIIPGLVWSIVRR